MNEPQIAPLKDDTSEWRDKSLWRDLLGFFFTNSVLEWRLRQQLKSRPNVWGIGLWPDAEHEEVAKICAEGFNFGYACDSINFIPDDPLNLIADLDAAHDLSGVEAVWAIERELGLTIPESALNDCTFGEMVRQLVALRQKRIGEGLPVISDEELTDRLKERCVTACGPTTVGGEIATAVEIAKLFLPWRLFPGFFPWLFALSLLRWFMWWRRSSSNFVAVPKRDLSSRESFGPLWQSHMPFGRDAAMVSKVSSVTLF